MNRKLLIFIILLIFQNTFAQIKIDEYREIDSDSESSHIQNLVWYLQKEPESKGLVVIYAGLEKERLGNILPHLEGFKSYISFYYKIDANRISFVVAKGKEPFSKEVWIAQKDEKFPEFKPIELNLQGITKKYFFARICLNCYPTVYQLATTKLTPDLFIDALKKNKNYEALILIERGEMLSIRRGKPVSVSSKEYAGYWRNLLVSEHKIENERVKIRFIRRKDDIGTAVYFYIIPKTDRIKKN